MSLSPRSQRLCLCVPPVPCWPDFVYLVPGQEVARGEKRPIISAQAPAKFSKKDFLIQLLNKITNCETFREGHSWEAREVPLSGSPYSIWEKCDQPQVTRDTGEASACSQDLYPHFIERIYTDIRFLLKFNCFKGHKFLNVSCLSDQSFWIRSNFF